VLNRVSEDGVLTPWFRAPHKKFGTTYRTINLIAILQIITIVASQGDTIVLGRGLAESIGATVGDSVTVYAPGNIQALIDEIRREGDDPANPKRLSELKNQIVMPAGLVVAGIFETGRNDYDANFLLFFEHRL